MKNQTKKITTKRGKLQKRDWVQSLIMTFIGGVVGSIGGTLTSLYDVIEKTGTFQFDYKLALIGALIAGISQLVRKLGQSEEGKFILEEIKILTGIIKVIKNKK